jgi:hypothetical protein
VLLARLDWRYVRIASKWAQMHLRLVSLLSDPQSARVTEARRLPLSCHQPHKTTFAFCASARSNANDCTAEDVDCAHCGQSTGTPIAHDVPQKWNAVLCAFNP